MGNFLSQAPRNKRAIMLRLPHCNPHWLPRHSEIADELEHGRRFYSFETVEFWEHCPAHSRNKTSSPVAGCPTTRFDQW